MIPLIQPLKPAYYADMESQLMRIFYAILFAPILKIVKDNTAQRPLQNAPDDPLRSALQSGRIQYSHGIFTGEFSAAIARALRSIGAAFDKRLRGYRLDEARVPAWVRSEATAYQMRAKSAHDEILRALNETVNHLEEIANKYQVDPEKSITAISSGFRRAAEAIKVNPQLSAEARAELNREYTKNMKVWIQEFTGKEITALRQRVEENAMQGYRFDRLLGSINGRISISQNKAKFLARQETSLFLAKFREKRFKDGGITRYRWSTAHDDRVRVDHEHLQGKVFSYDQPPITDLATGARNNPGQDYNCRCVDIPVLEGLDQ